MNPLVTSSKFVHSHSSSSFSFSHFHSRVLPGQAAHWSRAPASRREVQQQFYPARSYTTNVTLAPSRSTSTPSSRLSLISRHLDQRAYPPLYTPYSIDRASSISDDVPYNPLDRTPKRQLSTSSKMEASKLTNEESHPTLLIPGPIEISNEVAQSMSYYAQSHVGQPFVNVFGETLALTRKLFQTENPKSQPFIIAGSGTLGWDLCAANLAEPGDDVLVLHTGYFADSFADCFKIYGSNPTQLKGPIGGRPQLPEIEEALKSKKYKLCTVTHVDTSTGVLSAVQPLSDLIKRVSPDTLLVVDGVCSIGAEELHFDKMGIDFVLTASQKAIGAPPGLSISMASERAIEVFKNRKSPPGSYYASWKNWMPIMQNYEAKKPSYFATPATQLIQALHTALTQLLKDPISKSFEQHHKISQKVKKAVGELGLKQLAEDPANQANAMTAIYLPDGLTPPEILPTLMKKGVVFAGGLHKEIATKYIRFGHMGVSARVESRGDIENAISVLKESLAEVQKAKGQ